MKVSRNDYGVHTLVWYEQHESMTSAISREKAIKEWKRAWKLQLIESANPGWDDLYPQLIADESKVESGLRRIDEMG